MIPINVGIQADKYSKFNYSAITLEVIKLNNHLQRDVSLLVFIRQQKKYLSFTMKIENKIWNPARQRLNHKTTTLHCSNRPTQEAKCQIILLHVPHSKLPGVYEKISKNGKTNKQFRQTH